MAAISNTPLLISLEGNIGAGKSTLLEKLAEKLSESTTSKWVFLREPVHIWEQIRDASGTTILSKFYADPPKYAFAFQIMAYTTRLHELRRLLRENPNCRGIICERSLEADKHIFAQMLHDDGTMDDVMYQIYDRFFGEYEDEFRLNAVVYIDASAETCFMRVKSRARNGESAIPLEYLAKCRAYHEAWLNNRSSDEFTDQTKTKTAQVENESNIHQQNTMKMLHLNTNAIATFEDDLESGIEDQGNIWLNQIEAFLETL